MRKKHNIRWVCASLSFLFISSLIGQEPYKFPGPQSKGPADDFRLTIEPAWITPDQPNIEGKSELEKKFFPGHNRMVEFFFRDTFLGPHGFRIDTVSMNNYIMEVVWVSDFKDVNRRLSEEFPVKSILPKKLSDMTEEELKEIREFNREQRLQRAKRTIEEYTIERRKIPVSAAFFASMWRSYYGIIWNYTSRGVAPTSFDGYSVTFRCVVENFSVWTFFARNPLSLIEDFTTACNGIVKEVQDIGKIANEEEHIKQIEKLLREGIQNLKKHPSERIQFL